MNRAIFWLSILLGGVAAFIAHRWFSLFGGRFPPIAIYIVCAFVAVACAIVAYRIVPDSKIRYIGFPVAAFGAWPLLTTLLTFVLWKVRGFAP